MTSKAKVCRICMLGNTKGVISLFAVCNGSDRIYNKIMQVANIQISIQDGLPTWICYSCLVHLETSYQFKIQAEKSDQLLRKQLESTNKEELDVVVIDNQVNPLQKQSQLRGLLSKPKTSDACVGTAFRPKNDEVLFKEQQNDIQGHFMSEVCEGISLTDNEQNGIKITNVVSHAQPETLEGCSTEADNAQTLSEEAICTCAKNTDGSKCDTCKKISSDRTTDEDYNNCINDKTYQNEETSNDDMLVSKYCINRIIDFIENEERLSSNQKNCKKTLTSNSVYSCTQCGDCFADNELIEKFTQKTEKNFQCFICHESFMFKRNLNKHLLMHEGEPYRCNICGYTSIASNPDKRNSNMLHHMLTHAGKNIKCDVCPKRFKNEALLTRHKQKHINVKPYKCNECDRDFSRRNQLRDHKLTHLELKLKSKKKHECYICNKNFACEETVKAHILTHTDVKLLQCEACDYTTFSNRNLKRHMFRHSDEKPFTCGICAKSYQIQYDLNNHLLSHSNDKPFNCDRYEKSFSSKVSLNNHRNHHGEESRKYKCKHCNKAYKYKNLLKDHEESHSNPAQCKACSKQFQTQMALLMHNKVHHSGLGPQFVCEICGKGFMLNSLLNSHKVMHLAGSPLECDICNKKFPHKRSLRIHKRLVHHSNKAHQCHVCGKNFKHKSTLKIHIRTVHSDGEKVMCTVCKAEFTHKSALSTHTKILHAGLEPHSCEFCGQKFKWKQTCDKHKLKCTKKQ